jgi:hypothetical protein
MKKIKILKKVLEPKIGYSLAWNQKELYALGDENKDFDFEVCIIDGEGEIIEKIIITVPANIMADWDSDEKISEFILANLNLENLGRFANRVKINKEYSPKEAIKFTWSTIKGYDLENKASKNDLFVAHLYTKDDELILKKEIITPPAILEKWDNDETITNYLLSQLGLELDLDNTIDLVLAKLNSGTITYASGMQEENDAILQNYATFIALNIESYKEGSIEIDDFMDISDYDVNITLGTENFTIKEFVKSLVSLPEVEKTTKLNDCITAITAQIQE